MRHHIAESSARLPVVSTVHASCRKSVRLSNAIYDRALRNVSGQSDLVSLQTGCDMSNILKAMATARESAFFKQEQASTSTVTSWRALYIRPDWLTR